MRVLEWRGIIRILDLRTMDGLIPHFCQYMNIDLSRYPDIVDINIADNINISDTEKCADISDP